MDDLLTERWASLAGRSVEADRCGQDLLARWSQPHRHYHAVSHLRAVLDAIDMLAEVADEPDAVRLAAWFHDAVYDGRPGDDERASAALAAESLRRLGQTPELVDEVVRLVLLTIDHCPAPGDANGAVLCDADLSVLGAGAEDYRAYTDAVRRDYSHIADEEFRIGRAAVVERLLTKDPLFHTGTGRARWEAAARHNLNAELAQLRSVRPAK
ncbi:metal-dependent phosphohydrolase [Phytoactinopolyspora endophytica]|uniref:HD domain-containing protein n=1 Tax=Phytoactinopolyspora endophytica TaxID=1642495 RepID=UPI00101BA3EB|nr:metal-dependent phosphohydrolase [Phytoactinopolyspora endophytica]